MDDATGGQTRGGPRRLPRAFWILWAGSLVNKLGTFVVPFLALYLTRARGLAVDEAGAVVSLWGAGALVAGPVGGLAADRLGRRPTLLGALVLGAGAMLALSGARSIPAIAAASFALGLFGEAYRPASSAMVADVVPREDRVRAFALLHWAVNLGFAIAPVVAGIMAERSFTPLFVADAASTLVFAGLVGAFVPETRLQPDAALPAARRDAFAPYRDRPFVLFVGLTFALAAVFNQWCVALPLDMRAHGLDEGRFGLLLALNGALIVVLQPFAVPLVARFPRSAVLAGGAAIVGIGFGLNALASGTLGYATGIALWTLGEIAVTPVTPAVIAELSPPDLRGSYQGAHQLAWGGACFVGPLIGGFVVARVGYRVLWCGCLAAGLAVAVGQLALGRTLSSRSSSPDSRRAPQ